MQGTVHLLVGAAIGALIPYSPTAVVLAVGSHYLLDALPHIDPETFADGKSPYSVKQKVGLAVDIALVAILLTALFLVRNQPAHILLAAIAGQTPDLLIPLERYAVFLPLRRLHDMFHWREALAQHWSWYLAGIFTPLLVGGSALFFIWQSAPL